MEKQQILIIEDDPTARKNLSAILRIKGYEALNAKNGAEGLELLKQSSAHIAIIDLGLPDMPGIEVFNKAKENNPSIEIIVLAENTSLDSAIEATNKGAFSYLLKPFDSDQIILHVQRAIEMHETGLNALKHTVKPKGSKDKLAKKSKKLTNEIAMRKRAEEALMRNEVYFRSLIENSSDIITILNEDGSVRYMSPSIKHIAGFNPTEFMNRNIFEYVHPGDVCVARDVFSRTVQTFGTVLSAELRLLHNDGSWHTYETTAQNMLGNKAVKGVVINSHDITEYKLAEEALRKSEERFRAQYHGNPVPIFTWQSQGEDFVLVDYNNAAETITEGMAHKYVGRKATELCVNRQDLLLDLQRCCRKRKIIHRDTRSEHFAPGRDISVNYSFVPHDLVMMHVDDITDRKLAEQAMSREKNRLQTQLDFYHEADTRFYDIETFIIEECIKMTQSSLGFFGFINEDETLMTIHLWSEQAMKGCAIDFKPVEFPIKSAGIWAEAIREHTHLIINDYSGCDPRKKGYPDGHVPIKRLLCIPVIRGSKSVAVLAVANKETDYDEKDIPHLNLFLESVWGMLRRKRAEEALTNSEQKLKTIVYGSPIPQFFIDRNHRVVYWNDALVKLTGNKASEIIGTNQHWQAFFDKKRPCMADLLVEGDIKRISYLYRGKYKKSHLVIGAYEATDFFPRLGDEGKWLHITSVAIKDAVGQVIGALETIEDITNRKHAEEKVLAISITDQLTGLYNRRGFLTFVERQFKLSGRTKKGLLIFFADVDEMKWINDTLGHDEGDKALIEAASVLKETFRSSDIIARMGGDEFAILAIAIPEATHETLTNRLQSLVAARNKEKNRKYRLSISIGSAYYDPENPSSIDDLISQADNRMYEDKRTKKSCDS